MAYFALTIRYRAAMAQAPASRPRLDRRAWAAAALEAFASGGPFSVAVEPLARKLGVTKGSFYWHFPDRRSLLEAALELYEQEGTESVIATLRQQPRFHDQLDNLFTLVFREEGGDPVYHALLANAAEPSVAPVLKRITIRRLDYLAQAMTEIDYPPAEAHRRAVLAYTTWLGLIQTERAVGGRLFSSERARADYLAFLRTAVFSPVPRARQPQDDPGHPA